MRTRLTKNWSTHLPMLIKTAQMTDGPILEIGSGLYSTPLLHWLCYEKKRRLVTYENDFDYFNFARSFRSKNHDVRFVKDWDEMDIVNKHWSVVLIDHTPSIRRAADAIRLKNNADYIIIHDTEPEHSDEYDYDRIWPHFKYRYDWKGCKPWVTVVSNFKDLSNLQYSENIKDSSSSLVTNESSNAIKAKNLRIFIVFSVYSVVLIAMFILFYKFFL